MGGFGSPLRKEISDFLGRFHDSKSMFFDSTRYKSFVILKKLLIFAFGTNSVLGVGGFPKPYVI